MFYELSHISSADYFKKIYCSNFSFPPHLHNCFELVVCFSGEMNITVDDRRETIREGEALLIFPHQLHSFSYSESRMMICIFSPRIVSAFSSPRLLQKPMSNKFLPDRHLVSELDKLDEKGALRIKGLLYLMCASFDESAEYIKNENKSLLGKIFMFIGENFAGDCSLSTIARSMGYNESYISRYFKKCVGINLCDYINMVRISNVCYLYENSDNTILGCALESGFDSLRTFNRNFKKQKGVSPREYFKLKK